MTSPTDPAVLLRTERLAVRPWRMEEAERFFDMHRRMEVARWLSGKPMRELEEAVQAIERIRAELEADPRFGTWALVERAKEVPAGSILLKPLPDGDGEVEIGWHLHPDSWGKGLATEAASAFLQRGFSDGLREVWAVTYPHNVRSIAVCLRIGMRLLGLTERWYHVRVLMFWVGAEPGQAPSLAPDEPASLPLG